LTNTASFHTKNEFFASLEHNHNWPIIFTVTVPPSSVMLVFYDQGFRWQCREDHYQVFWLDIQQNSNFSNRYGYPKTAFNYEPNTDKDIRSETLYPTFW